MKTAGCKQKGRLGQQEIVKILLQTCNQKIAAGTFGSRYPELSEDDIRSTPMGSQGEDILLSTAARRLLPWNIEVKRGKAFNLVTAVKQADSRSKSVLCPSLDCLDEKENCGRCKGTGSIKYISVAMGRYDHDKKWYATVELDYLLSLIGGREWKKV